MEAQAHCCNRLSRAVTIGLWRRILTVNVARFEANLLETKGVRQQVGFVVQALVLMFLPLLIGWQLFFGFPLIWMPACLLVAIIVFSVGQILRKP